MKRPILGALLLALSLQCEGGYQSMKSREAESVLAELPPCSRLRQELASSTRPQRQEEPYIREMRALGVKRGFFEVHSIWKQRRPTALEFVRRLYFSQYDDSKSLIMDPAKLDRILKEGLQSTLDGVARDRITRLRPYDGFEGHMGNPEGKRMFSRVEYFSTPVLPEETTRIYRLGKNADDLSTAAGLGDSFEIERYIKNGVPRDLLTKALFSAVIGRYDNSQAIRTLVEAGADINAHAKGDKATPLIRAVRGSPCNIPVLLQLGARVQEQDKWGQTALKLAEEEKETAIVRLLLSQSAH
jgi:Ankyrin repeats (3 copies)